MDLGTVLTHLKNTLTGVNQVGAAADLATASGGKVSAPAVFILPREERVVEDDLDGDSVTLQVVFTVISVASNRSDAAGKAALTDVEVLRSAIKGALSSLVLAGAQVPPRFVSGGVIHFSKGLLWWGDEFVVDFFEF